MSEHDPTDIEGEFVEQTERKTARNLDALTEKEDFSWLLSSERGRRLAWRILELTHPYASSMTGDTATFFQEGERNIGLKLIGKLAHADKPAFAKMMQEHFNP